MFKLATSFLSRSSRVLNEGVFKKSEEQKQEEVEEQEDDDEEDLDLTMEELTPTSSTPEDVIDLTDSWSERVITQLCCTSLQVLYLLINSFYY